MAIVSDSKLHFVNCDFADYLRVSMLLVLLIEVAVELVKRGSTALLTRTTCRTTVFTGIHPRGTPQTTALVPAGKL